MRFDGHNPPGLRPRVHVPPSERVFLCFAPTCWCSEEIGGTRIALTVYLPCVKSFVFRVVSRVSDAIQTLNASFQKTTSVFAGAGITRTSAVGWQPSRKNVLTRGLFSILRATLSLHHEVRYIIRIATFPSQASHNTPRAANGSDPNLLPPQAVKGVAGIIFLPGAVLFLTSLLSGCCQSSKVGSFGLETRSENSVEDRWPHVTTEITYIKLLRNTQHADSVVSATVSHFR